MSHTLLNKFGYLLMTRVRDESIDHWRMIVSGKMKGERAVKLRQDLEKWGAAAEHAISEFVPHIVDTTLHNLLVLIEQEESLKLAVEDRGVRMNDIRELSDGLAGELYSDQGWISRFSKVN